MRIGAIKTLDLFVRDLAYLGVHFTLQELLFGQSASLGRLFKEIVGDQLLSSVAAHLIHLRLEFGHLAADAIP
jgi:hypothetical protein